MFAQIEYPENLLPEELDEYLEKGWFRMRQTIFTTNFLHFHQLFYSAIWLRVTLNDAIHDKKYLALKKGNKGFNVEIKKTGIGGISLQHETLYQLYRQSVSFEVSPSLHELLIGHQSYNRFNTYNVNIYDGDMLIAAGFFDLGKTSAAGITSVYHPAYKKYSLGKYLVYLKMDFCKQQGLQYFYPGYIVPGYSSFDYKLEIGRASLQYLQLSSQQWIDFNPAKPVTNPLAEMCEKLGILKTVLEKNDFSTVILYYKFFEANLDPYYHGSELFDFPVFLHCFYSVDTGFYTVIGFNVCDQNYHLLSCSSVINIGRHQNAFSIFDSDLLRVEADLFATEIAEEMNRYLASF